MYGGRWFGAYLGSWLGASEPTLFQQPDLELCAAYSLLTKLSGVYCLSERIEAMTLQPRIHVQKTLYTDITVQLSIGASGLTTEGYVTCVTSLADTKIAVAQGAGRVIRITATDEDGSLVDLTNALIWFTVRARTDDVASVMSKRSLAAGGSAAEIEIMDQVTSKGQFRVKILSTNTKNLSYTAAYWYDCWIQLVGEEPTPVISRSEFVISPSITRL